MTTIQCRDIKFERIEAIIFDKDGTLEDSEDFLRLLGHKRSRIIDARVPGTGDPLLMAFGLTNNTLDPTGLLAVGSRGENEIAAAAYIAETGRGWLDALEIARAAFDEADEFFKKNATPSPLFVGCLEAIVNLSQAGLKLGILSAASTARVQAFAQHYQLDTYLQLQMGVDSGPSKPDPALFLQACQSLGVEPGVTLMVGDSPADFQMAKRAGAAGCIGISWRPASSDRLAGADVAIASLEEILIQS
ncbi:HAD family hydrolase [Laspinema olomoucense]|uniref:HAD family hydrolase n=1 Tax=Laspinema olomoucense D3b TaxID=2953688 RepID=A0ABT2NDY9_9CYAN|nr:MULTISPECIES: HAD family hydrolase [unclassified Laspinema]MCT7973728.1 HAD family hydrolase [Laspinema sp. D3d]MCT7980908.1 HAD family hydrolase [Laspinema sp. D3b]MCT7988087.1 HAD family hydrolase [Laspinema sp. D3a]MCT7995171.1 HAD family hydrolase [Laspinema sp. D3c]